VFEVAVKLSVEYDANAGEEEIARMDAIAKIECNFFISLLFLIICNKFLLKLMVLFIFN